MNPDLPPHLHATRDLLRQSLHREDSESPPPIPEDLQADLERQLGSRTSRRTTRTASASWPRQILSWLTTPAFGVAALAIAALGFTLSSRFGHDPFRGQSTADPIPPAPRIILLQASQADRQALLDSGRFDPEAVQIQSSTPANSPALILDFSTREMTYQDLHGAHPPIGFPDDPSKLPEVVADEITRHSLESH